MEATLEEQYPGEDPGQRLMSITLTRVRDLLEAGGATMPKLAAQESLAGGKWVTYGQIKAIIQMRLQGLDWNEVITDPPAVLPPSGSEEMPPPF